MPFQSKKGVKRKADTTTPVVNANAPFDPTFKPVIGAPKTQLPAASIASGRRESIRQIKRPKKDLPEDHPQHSTKRRPTSTQLRYCHNLIKEMLAKKHAVNN